MQKLFLLRFRYRHCCVSVIMRPSSSHNAAPRAFWVWGPWVPETSRKSEQSLKHACLIRPNACIVLKHVSHCSQLMLHRIYTYKTKHNQASFYFRVSKLFCDEALSKFICQFNISSSIFVLNTLKNVVVTSISHKLFKNSVNAYRHSYRHYKNDDKKSCMSLWHNASLALCLKSAFY